MGAAAYDRDLVDEFNNFIESVMAGTNLVSIHTFSLNAIRRDRFPLWVSRAIMRNVREMEIDIIQYAPMQLPAYVYSSMTLEVLRLHTSFRLEDPPDGVFFPQLKILQIYITHLEN